MEECAVSTLPLGFGDPGLLLQETPKLIAVLLSPRGGLHVQSLESFVSDFEKRLEAGVRGRRGFRRRVFLFSLVLVFGIWLWLWNTAR